MTDLRIVSIFMVVVASGSGCAAAFIFKGRNMLFFKMFSAGVILSLALVHIIGESISSLQEVMEYPLGGVCALLGLLVMIIVEHMSHSWNAKDSHSHAQHVQQAPITVPPSLQYPQQAYFTPQPPVPPQFVPMMPQQALSISPISSHPIHQPQSFSSLSSQHAPHCHVLTDAVKHRDQLPPHNHAPGDHAHTCITNLNSSNWIASAGAPNPKRNTFMVYMFEFACLFHSVFIGIAIGVTTDQEEVRGLMVAVLFHQALEGMSLGCVIAESSLGRWKSLSMMCAYSMITSIGIATGMGIETMYTEGDRTRLLISGIFQGISGGLLLYVSLFQIIAEEFSKDELHRRESWMWKAGMYVSLLLGAAAMCLLGIWL